jgi:hypothetical protein
MDMLMKSSRLKRKVMPLSEKVEVLGEWDNGMSTLPTPLWCKQTDCLFHQENEDNLWKMLSPVNCKNYLCMLLWPLPQKGEKDLCVWPEDETQKWLSFTGAVVRKKAMPVNDELKTVPEILESSGQKVSTVLTNPARHQQFTVLPIWTYKLSICPFPPPPPPPHSCICLIRQSSQKWVDTMLTVPSTVYWMHMRPLLASVNAGNCNSFNNCKVNVKGSMDKLLWMDAGRSFGLKQLMISRDSSQAGWSKTGPL